MMSKYETEKKHPKRGINKVLPKVVMERAIISGMESIGFNAKEHLGKGLRQDTDRSRWRKDRMKRRFPWKGDVIGKNTKWTKGWDELTNGEEI